ncbi:MAG: VWA domain-containing protein [Candidatus Coatesbacteria bacterium]|nr:VWA domain-containing protein [Candidatus Coatesbacteria bacterium]
MKKILIITMFAFLMVGGLYADDENLFTSSVKSDVIIILDTSGSMMWDVHQSSNTYRARWKNWSYGGDFGAYCDSYGCMCMGVGLKSWRPGYPNQTNYNYDYFGFMGLETWNDLTNTDAIDYCHTVRIDYSGGWSSGYVTSRGEDKSDSEACWPTDSRLYICKDVMHYVLSTTKNLRLGLWGFGLYNYSYTIESYYQPVKRDIYTSGANYYAKYKFPRPYQSGDWAYYVQYWLTYTQGYNSAIKYTDVSDDQSEALTYLNNQFEDIYESGGVWYLDGEFVAIGGTPTKCAFDSVKNYYIREINYKDGPAGYAVCRKYFVFLLTDGVWNNCGDPKPTIASMRNTSTSYGIHDIKTYVVGFTADNALKMELDAMAQAGGTNHAYAATSREELLDSLEKIFQMLDSTAYSFSVASVPTVRVTDSDSLAYFANFIPSMGEFWKGHLYCTRLNTLGEVVDTLWDLHDNLRTMNYASRNLYYETSAHTRNPWSSVTTTDLNVSNTARRDSIYEFQRGNPTLSVGGTGRQEKLGDIFHSSPVLLGVGGLYYFGPGYYDFYNNVKKTRVKTLVFGANDGWFRGIYASGASEGNEAWGLAPNPTLRDLQKIAASPRRHFYYMDGSPSAADIRFVSDSTNVTHKGWHTMAIVGMGIGNGNSRTENGTYYTQLELSYPTTCPTAPYSFTHAKMGHTWSEATIFNTVNKNIKPWVAAMGFGFPYPSKADSTKGKYLGIWVPEDKVWATTIPTDHYMVASPSAFSTVMDVDGLIRVRWVSATGLGGNGFMVSGSYPNSVVYMFNCSDSTTVSNWTGKKIFTVDDQYRYLYFSPTFAFDNNSNTELWGYLGSGDKEDPLDTLRQNYFYAIKDVITRYNANTVIAESSLGNAGAANANGWRYMFKAITGETNSKHKGEKVLGKAIVFNGVVYFTTYTPDNITTCTKGAGIARLYGLDFQTGSGKLGTANKIGEVIGSGVPSPPSLSIGPDGARIMVMTALGLVSYNIGGTGIEEDYIYWKRRIQQ